METMKVPGYGANVSTSTVFPTAVESRASPLALPSNALFVLIVSLGTTTPLTTLLIESFREGVGGA
jgi:hypothetical protein